MSFESKACGEGKGAAEQQGNAAMGRSACLCICAHTHLPPGCRPLIVSLLSCTRSCVVLCTAVPSLILVIYTTYCVGRHTPVGAFHINCAPHQPAWKRAW